MISRHRYFGLALLLCVSSTWTETLILPSGRVVVCVVTQFSDCSIYRSCV
jgi:hypothetical protein